MSLSRLVEPYDATDHKLRNSLEVYCANLVKIQDKEGLVRPFVWREAQRQLHQRLEKQLDERGLVRAIVLKARRLGISTYVGARFYHGTTMWRGLRAFILTHEDRATQQLFAMVKLIHENMADEYRPPIGAANANELNFAQMDSGYRVGTAKNIFGAGRGLTLQLFHGSEVAHWPHAEGHFAGALKAVSLVNGTEVILESTANGVSGSFYEQWGKAERGQSDFIPIFLPWYVDPENRRKLTKNYEPSTGEEEYQRLYQLDDEQLCWSHFENVQLGGEPGVLCALFRQENPACAAEAFQGSTGDAFIPNEAILRARRWRAPDQSFLPRVLGVDVARTLGGGDQTRIVDRQGRKAGRIDIALNTDDTTVVAAQIMKLLRDNPDISRAYIDITGGLGAGPFDICRANGFKQRVAGVDFGSSPLDGERYFNKRAEMWGLMREWFLEKGGADIPDDDLWHRHIAAPEHIPPDVNSRVRLEPKERIKKRIKMSPDLGDALALTFAEPLAVQEPDERPKWMRDLDIGPTEDEGGDWMTT